MKPMTSRHAKCPRERSGSVNRLLNVDNYHVGLNVCRCKYIAANIRLLLHSLYRLCANTTSPSNNKRGNQELHEQEKREHCYSQKSKCFV